jgi:hypothetical protein
VAETVPKAAAPTAAPLYRAFRRTGRLHHGVRGVDQRVCGAPRALRHERLGEHPQAHHPVLEYRNSAAIELPAGPLAARLEGRRPERFNFWWSAATVLGILFLAGQAYAWYQLRQAGMFISTNPASSFFYVFTAAHAAHILGGVAALVYVDVQALRLRLGPAKRTWIDVTAIFWHFLDGLWLYLMILFYVWG